jgi:hypothetical protein
LFERWQARLLLAAYKERLRALVAVLPGWVIEEMASISRDMDE